jgi:hypothetical protein
MPSNHESWGFMAAVSAAASQTSLQKDPRTMIWADRVALLNRLNR